MPTYDYECLECHERYEVFQRITEEPLKNCINCNGKVKRLISAGGGLIFKGSGFYITDYKNNRKVRYVRKNERKNQDKSNNSNN